MTKLAQLIAKEEGFFTTGTLPARNNNPGDLRHSPHSEHQPDAPNAIGVIDNNADGWEDLERQLRLDADRGMDLKSAIYSWAPPSENNTEQYLNDILDGFGIGSGVSALTPLSKALEIMATTIGDSRE